MRNVSLGSLGIGSIMENLPLMLDNISEQLGTLSTLLSVCLEPVRDDDDLNSRMEIIDELYSYAETVDDIPAQFAELIADKVYEYESRTIVIPELTQGEVLAFLIKNNDLKQAELKGIAPQSVISEVINGKRNLTVEQIKKLSLLFNVPLDIFFRE